MYNENTIERLRSYSSVFSGMAFLRLINKNDYSFIDRNIQSFDPKFKKEGKTYFSYIRYMYSALLKSYRCEYVYKNAIINHLLLDKYHLQETVGFNEFRVGCSIVDLALFNGTSKAFEIKTELDSSKRLRNQLNDYKKLFSEYYIVTHESLANKYLIEDREAGIIILTSDKKPKLEEIRPPVKNIRIDAEFAIRSLRTSEYCHIIKDYYGKLPDVNSFKLFDACLFLMKEIPKDHLHALFLNEIKKRRLDKKVLNSCPKELKQICLSLNLNTDTFSTFRMKLNQSI